MKVLVTGGAGFIGSHLVDALLASGHEVQVIDNLATGWRANVPKAAVLHECDIHARESARVFEAFQPEVVFHLAAQSSVKVSTTDPVHDLEVNGGGTAAIAALCVQFGVRKLVYFSTGGALYGDPEVIPVPESHPIAPLSPYGLSKRVGELYLELFARTSGLEFTILRPANVFGPRQDPLGEAGVVAIFAGRMLAGEPCTIDGDGEQTKDYLYVSDVVDAALAAVERGSGLALNIGAGKGISVNAIFAALRAATGATAEPAYGPPRPGDVRHIALESARARELLGWQPRVPFDEGIRRTVDYIRAASPPVTR